MYARKLLPLLLISCAAPLFAEELIPPSDMVKVLQARPVECVLNEFDNTTCDAVTEYAFLGSRRGFASGTSLLEIEDDYYVRMTFTDALSVTENGLCSTGNQSIKDTYLELVGETAYLGEFRRDELDDDLRTLLEGQVINPMAALLEGAVACQQYYYPDGQHRPNELSYKSFLDGEVIEEGRVLLLTSADAHRIELAPMK